MKLYIFRYEILDNDGKKNEKLEKIVKSGIMDSKRLYDQREKYGKKDDEYYLVGDRSQNSNYSFYSIKKKTSIARRVVVDKTATIIKKTADNDDLGKFAINYSEDLIFFYYNGSFGTKQFREVVIEIIRKALLEEGIVGYRLIIKNLGCQPQNWKLETLKEHLEKTRFIKELSLSLTYPNRHEDTREAGKTEMYFLAGKSKGITLQDEDIKKIVEQFENYKNIGKEEYISFECEDTEGHPFTINKSRILNFDVDSLDNMEKFEVRVKDAMDEYIRLYY